MGNDAKCRICKSLLNTHDKCVCLVCGTIQRVDCVKPGDRLIYYPTSVREGQELEGYCNAYQFYPGMEMTVESVVEHPSQKGLYLIKAEEVSDKDVGFIAADFRKKEFVTEIQRREIFLTYLDSWQFDKFKFFEFRVGRKVIFKPRFITKTWYKDNPLFAKLSEGEIYEITKTISRRYLWLNDVPLNIYWRDVEKIK